MAAHEHLSPEQLRLFATGTEVKAMVNYSFDADPGQGSYDQVHQQPGERPRIVHVPSTPRESLDQTWQRKLTEAKSTSGAVHGAGVYDSIAREGYRPHTSPITLVTNSTNGKRFLADGHHRVAAAAAVEGEGRGPVWVPLRYAVTST